MQKKCHVHMPTIHGGLACGYWLTLAVTDHSQVNLAKFGRFGYTPNMKVNTYIYIRIFLYSWLPSRTYYKTMAIQDFLFPQDMRNLRN